MNLFFRVNRSQVFECHTAAHLVRFFEVHAVNAAHREVLILFARRADETFDRIANLEVEFTDKVLAHIDVVRAGLVVLIRHAEESVTLRRDFEHAFRINDIAFVFEALQNIVEGLLAHSAEVHFFLHGEFLQFAHGELAELEPVFLGLQNSFGTRGRERRGIIDKFFLLEVAVAAVVLIEFVVLVELVEFAVLVVEPAVVLAFAVLRLSVALLLCVRVSLAFALRCSFRVLRHYGFAISFA